MYQSWFARKRKEKGISQRDMYKACGVSGPKWMKLEENPFEFKVKDLNVIAPLFDLTPGELLQEINQHHAETNNNDLPNKVIQLPGVEILYTLRAAVTKEGLTWREFGEIANAKSHSSAKRNVETWINKTNAVLNKMGYKIGLIKQK